MDDSLTVIEVLHTEEELSSFPVEGALNISMSGKPDLYNIGENAYIARHDGGFDDQMPNMANRYVRAVGDVSIDRYDIIESEVAIEDMTTSWNLSIRPKQALIPKAAYYIILSKNLVPEYYTINKTLSLGPASVEMQTPIDSTGINATYELTITTESTLSSGSHIVGFSVLKDGAAYRLAEIVDILSGPYMMDTGIQIAFSSQAPFMVGETFSITCIEFTRNTTTLVQEITTFLDDTVIQPSAAIQSSRLQEADVLSFYEQNGWSRRVPGLDEGIGVIGASIDLSRDDAYSTQHPDTIRIDTKVDIDPASLVDSVIEASIGYAFGNYMLPDMGLWSNDQYEITYSLETPQVIMLRIVVSDSVPIGDRFMLTRDIP